MDKDNNITKDVYDPKISYLTYVLNKLIKI